MFSVNEFIVLLKDTQGYFKDTAAPCCQTEPRLLLRLQGLILLPKHDCMYTVWKQNGYFQFIAPFFKHSHVYVLGDVHTRLVKLFKKSSQSFFFCFTNSFPGKSILAVLHFFFFSLRLGCLILEPSLSFIPILFWKPEHTARIKKLEKQ